SEKDISFNRLTTRRQKSNLKRPCLKIKNAPFRSQRLNSTCHSVAWLFYPFNYVVPKLCLNRFRSLSLLKGESGFFELLNHLASCESSKVSSGLCRWTLGDVFCEGAEFFAFIKSNLDVFGFCLRFDKNVCTVDFVYHDSTNFQFQNITVARKIIYSTLG